MHREFELESATLAGTLTGRNGAAELPVGTVFTSLVRERIDLECAGSSMVSGALREVVETASVQLTVREVQLWNRSFYAAPSRHSAGLRVEGEGLRELMRALQSRGERDVFYLRASQDA